MEQFIKDLTLFGKINDSFTPWQDRAFDGDRNRVNREAMLSRKNIHFLAHRLISLVKQGSPLVKQDNTQQLKDENRRLKIENAQLHEVIAETTGLVSYKRKAC